VTRIFYVVLRVWCSVLVFFAPIHNSEAEIFGDPLVSSPFDDEITEMGKKRKSKKSRSRKKSKTTLGYSPTAALTKRALIDEEGEGGSSSK
jgi:hypothetical protein